MSFPLPALPYDYNALEPYLDAQTMEIHHSKHHAAYINTLNAALEKYSTLSTKTLEELVTHSEILPEDIQTTIRNHGGGHFNHSLFWTFMKPFGGGEPKGILASAIAEAFGNYANFKDTFTKTALSRFGSGWAWLGVKNGKLTVLSLPNQDVPLLEGLQPILGLDVWEHAYYLKYQNRRAEYISNWWNVVNWDEVARRYQELK